MLSYHCRPARSSEQSDSHHTSSSSFSRDRSSFSSRSNATHGSLRSRLTGFTENLTGSVSSGRKGNRRSYGSISEYSPTKATRRVVATALKNSTVKHWEHMNQAWAASQKHTGPMSSPSDHPDGNHTSEDSRRSVGGASFQSSLRHLRTGLRASQKSARRVLTAVSRIPPVASDRLDSRVRRARHSSFGAVTDVSSKSDCVPRLPSLDDAGDFRESLRKTRVFQTLPPAETKDMSADIAPAHVNTVSVLEAFIDRRVSLKKRLPIRLKHRDRAWYEEPNTSARAGAEDQRELRSTSINSKNILKPIKRGQEEPAHRQTTVQHTISQNTVVPEMSGVPQNSPRQMSSRTPVEWTDRVLESSYVLRNPVSPELVLVDIEDGQQFVINVKVPKRIPGPRPLARYACMHVALVDITERFSMHYSQVAEWHICDRTIVLRDIREKDPKYIDIDGYSIYIHMGAFRSILEAPRIPPM